MIDRYRLVNRHNPVLKGVRIESPLSVGNGEFAFTADITGLQSFPDLYKEEIPLTTMAQWGWHSFKVDKKKYGRDKLRLELYRNMKRGVPYPSNREGQEKLFDILRHNPHKFHLGQLGFNMKMPDGNKVELSDIEDIDQKLDIWQGIITSRFAVQGIPVIVKTICHPFKDILAVSIESDLIKEKRLNIDIKFPYGSIDKSAADWNNTEKHRTEMMKLSSNRTDFIRIMDNERYFVSFISSDSGEVRNLDKHYYQFKPSAAVGKISFLCEFSGKPLRSKPPLTFFEVEKKSQNYWSDFWNKGGVIDLSSSSDERAYELERRIVLSQYLTAIQCSGSYPPQETGLTCNSWYGKFHLEMHFWHAAHFPVWGRPELLEKSLWWYHSILDRALELAKSQGYRGARWPKMVGPDGYDSPSHIGPFLIWQQPHPILYAELLYRITAEKNILDYYKEIVFNTAEFMVSYAEYDSNKDRYVLGPALIPAQECHKPDKTINPTFELEYWYFALNIAQEWRKRLGLDINNKWQEVIDKLSKPPVKDGLYLAHENCSDTFEKKNYDHPSMLGAFGVLPGDRVDPEIMLNTLKKCKEEWQFDEVWGWDFPMMAMTAARLGEAELAVDLLLMDFPKNTYMTNGHNRQGDKDDLPLYLPGNGALLLAVGMMAAGWEGSGEKYAPGFPDNSLWNVDYEDIKRYF